MATMISINPFQLLSMFLLFRFLYDLAYPFAAEENSEAEQFWVFSCYY